MEHELLQTEADRYVILEYLAEGGMGAIFLGKKIGMEGFEKEVVLKQLLPEFTAQPEFIDLFIREAKLSATLDHANIVHTIDLVAAGEDFFIVMEYVRGGDLRTILRRIKQRGHELHPAAALFIAREVLSALAYAHEKKSPEGDPLKLIHRDISPSNVMVSGAGEVKLTDFGIAKVSTHKSVFYRVKGKVGYMSPEQAYADRPLDHRSDLYSLAVCLHEMLSNERLFVADLLSTPDQIYSQRIARLEGRPNIPMGIDQVLATALARDPDHRYQTALDFQDALVKVAYDNAMIFTSPDLATHLKEICGEKPTDWNKEEDEERERPGTEVLPGDSGDQLSGVVELTSVFTGLPHWLGPEPKRPDIYSPPPEHLDGTTRHRGIPAKGMAFEPTRLAEPTVPRASLPAAPSFDLSEYSEGPSEPPLGESPTSPQTPLFPEHQPDEGLHPALAEMSGLTPGIGEWSGSDENDPTVALPDGANAVALVTDRPPIVPGELSPLDEAEVDQEATVELRVHRARLAARADPSRVRRTPRPAAKSEPALLTAQVRSTSKVQAKAQRHRILLLVATALLLLSGVAIVVLVGLTGPTLDDSPLTELLPDKQPTGPSVVALDSGPPDLHQLAVRSDVGAPDLAEPLSGSRSLKVDSTPSGARVYLDDVHQCRTPCTIEELEESRVYLLSVRRDRYVTWSSLVDMRGKRRVHVDAYLSEEPDSRSVGYLLLHATPRADVLVDNKEIGRVTSEGRIPLPPGQYEITLKHPRRTKRPRFVVTIHARETVLLWPKF